MTQANDTLIHRGTRRLRRRLTLAWSLAWIGGIALFTLFAQSLTERLHDERLAKDLAYSAVATYGLTWFEDDGSLRKDLFLREPELSESPFEISIFRASDRELVLAPESPRFRLSFPSIVEEVLTTEDRIAETREDSKGHPVRLHAIPTYAENEDRIVGVIVVVGDREQVRDATARMRRRLWLLASLISLLGLSIGLWLAHRSVAPLATSLHQRERFLAAAAHELRTPLSSLRAIADSALLGDEEPERALKRSQSVSQRFSHVVDDLLAYARLESGALEIERRELRLDLLIESLVDDELSSSTFPRRPAPLTPPSPKPRCAI